MSLPDEKLALFVLLGQSADKVILEQPGTVPSEPLMVSDSSDLSLVLPEEVKEAIHAASIYKYLFVFEQYLRNLVIAVLDEISQGDWWALVPADVRSDIERLEQTEEAKSWMDLEAREKIALATYPQLLRIIDDNWKNAFEMVIRDKSLIQEARMISHTRNTLCHMSDVSEEEVERVKQVMRDWFRMVSP